MIYKRFGSTASGGGREVECKPMDKQTNVDIDDESERRCCRPKAVRA